MIASYDMETQELDYSFQTHYHLDRLFEFVEITNANVTVRIYGIIVGCIFNGTAHNPYETRSLISDNILHKDVVSAIISNLIGNCLVKVTRGSVTEIYSSAGSAGFYYFQHPEGQIMFFNVEKDAHKSYFQHFPQHEFQKDLENLFIERHQLNGRAPFCGFHSNVRFLPPGFKIRCDCIFHLPEPNFIPNNKTSPDFLITETMRLWRDFICDKQGRIYLSFSGGLDSTYVAALLRSHNIDFTAYYVDYGKLREEEIARQVATELQKKISIRRAKYFENAFENIVQRCELSPGGFTGKQYIGYSEQDILDPSDLNDNVAPCLILNGQFSDTFYHVDHFGPPSFVTGYRRKIKLLLSYHLRARFSYPVLKLVLYFSKNSCLIAWKKYCTATTLLNDEHVKPLSNVSMHRSNNAAIRYIYKPIHTVIRKLEKSGDDNLISASDRLNYYVRLTRWLRSVHNAKKNMQVTELNSKNIVVLPFCEGPVSNYFLFKKLGFFECIPLKRDYHRCINESLGKKYNEIRESIDPKYPQPTLLHSLYNRIFKHSKSSSSRPAPFVEHQELIFEHLKKSFYSICNKDSDATNQIITKKDQMQISRAISLRLFKSKVRQPD